MLSRKHPSTEVHPSPKTDSVVKYAEFSQKLDELFESYGQKKVRNDKRTEPNEEVTTLPDIHAEWRARGETEFRFWINEQPVAALRMLIRTHELDPARRTEKWREMRMSRPPPIFAANAFAPNMPPPSCA